MMNSLRNLRFGVPLSMLLLVIGCGQGPKEADNPWPPAFSWLEQGAVTPAKDQGPFGTCGVFAAMGVTESLVLRASGRTLDLSEQHYLNASDTWVETGVNPGMVFAFIRDHGVVVESRLPYEGQRTGTLPEGEPDVRLSSFGSLALESLPPEERRHRLKELLSTYGPVAVVMDMLSDLRGYRGGLYIPGSSATGDTGHWVVLVGWQDDPGMPNGGCWVVKNSFGPSWGEQGCFRIPYDTAGLDRYVAWYAVYRAH